MLKSFAITNFKAFGKPVVLNLSRVNLLYGENSSGKSSIIQALLLLKQTLTTSRVNAENSVLDFRGPIVDLGGYGAAVHAHDLDSGLELAVTVAASDSTSRGVTYRRPPWDSHEVEYKFTFRFDQTAGKTRLSAFGLRSSGFELRYAYGHKSDTDGLFLEGSKAIEQLLKQWLANKGDRGLTPQVVDPLEVSVDDVKWVTKYLARTPAEALSLFPIWDPQELRTKRVGRPIGGSLTSTRRVVLQEFLFDWQFWMRYSEYRLANEFADLHYVGPLRQPPQRITLETSSPSNDLGSRGERALPLLSANPALLEELNATLRDLDIPYDLKISPLRAGHEEQGLGEISILSLLDRRTGLLITLADVGVGISQIVPVLMQLMLHEDSIVVVEQPELHLHPRLQAKLADVIAASVERRRNTVVLETHSEHILLRLQRRVRSAGSALSARDLGVYYVQQGQNEATLTRLRIDRQGELMDAWPPGFFDDRLEDLLAEVATAAAE